MFSIFVPIRCIDENIQSKHSFESSWEEPLASGRLWPTHYFYALRFCMVWAYLRYFPSASKSWHITLRLCWSRVDFQPHYSFERQYSSRTIILYAQVGQKPPTSFFPILSREKVPNALPIHIYSMKRFCQTLLNLFDSPPVSNIEYTIQLVCDLQADMAQVNAWDSFWASHFWSCRTPQDASKQSSEDFKWISLWDKHSRSSENGERITIIGDAPHASISVIWPPDPLCYCGNRF